MKMKPIGSEGYTESFASFDKICDYVFCCQASNLHRFNVLAACPSEPFVMIHNYGLFISRLKGNLFIVVAGTRQTALSENEQLLRVVKKKREKKMFQVNNSSWMNKHLLHIPNLMFFFSYYCVRLVAIAVQIAASPRQISIFLN